MKLWVVAVLLVSSCGALPVTSARTPTPSASAGPSPSPVRSAVLAIVAGPKRSMISLVDSNGVVLASAPVDPAPLVVNSVMSWTSASLTRLYFLSAGTEVRFIAPDGSSGTATRIAVAANEQAGFAVSPDDKRIAVSIFTYSPSFSGMRLYVEDLQGGGHHIDIFTSPTAAEFPVGWIKGRLVMSISRPDCCTALTLNPYAATSYHVVDPANGNRLVTLCGGSIAPFGPVEPFGALCVYDGAPHLEHWDGSTFYSPAIIQIGVTYLGAMTPDATRFVGGGDPMRITGNASDGSSTLLNSVGRGYVLGFLDTDRFVYQRDLGGPLRLFGITTGTGANISSSGSAYLGTFPPAIS